MQVPVHVSVLMATVGIPVEVGLLVRMQNDAFNNKLCVQQGQFSVLKNEPKYMKKAK